MCERYERKGRCMYDTDECLKREVVVEGERDKEGEEDEEKKIIIFQNGSIRPGQ